MSKGVIESHVRRFQERPGLRFQDLVFIKCQLFNSPPSPVELLDHFPAHTRELEVLLGSPDAVAGCFELRCHQLVKVRLVESAIIFFLVRACRHSVPDTATPIGEQHFFCLVQRVSTLLSSFLF